MYTVTRRRPVAILAIAAMLLCVAIGAFAEDSAPSLEDWSGTWNSVELYLEDEAVSAALKEAAEKMEMAEEDLKTMYADMFSGEGVGSFVIDADTVTAYAGQNGEGTALWSARFGYADTLHIASSFNGMAYEMDWYCFAMEGDSPDHYASLLLTKAGADEEGGMIHFHYRFGADDFDTLANMEESWWPTMCDAESTTTEMMIDELAGE